MRDLSMYSTSSRNRARTKSCHFENRSSVIVNMNGTLFDTKRLQADRADYAAYYRALMECPPRYDTIDILARFFRKGYRSVVVTAIPDTWRGEVNDWLTRHLTTPFDGPFMRENGDLRDTVDVKGALYHQLRQRYLFFAALDDDPDMVKAWTHLGVTHAMRVDHDTHAKLDLAGVK